MPPKTAKAPTSPPSPPFNEEGLGSFTSPIARDVQFVSLGDIFDDGENHRLSRGKDDDAAIAALAVSFRQHGIQQPVLLWRDVMGKLHTVYGFRRLAAAKIAGWDKIPAQILGHIPDPAEIHALRGVENLHRQPLSPADEALAAMYTVEACGGDVTKAAARLGVKNKWVQDRLYLQRLAPKVRDELAAGQLNLAQARELAKVGDPKAQEGFCRSITYDFERGVIMSAEKVRSLIDQAKHSLRQVQWDVNVPFAGKPACAGCRDNTATDVSLFDTSKEEAEKGCCMNPACYDVKVRKVGAELSKLQEKAAKMKGKEIRAEERRALAPEFVKTTAVDRVVKQAVGTTPAAGKKGESKGAEKSKPKTEKERRQEALLKWGKAFEKWLTDAQTRLEKVCNEHPAHRLILPYIYELRILDKAPQYDFPTTESHIDPNWGCFKNAVTPPEEKPVPPAVASFLNRVKAALNTPLPEPWVAFLNVEERKADINFYRESPEMVRRWCDVFGAEFVEPPKFEDFLPDDLKSKKPGAAEASTTTSAKTKKAKASAKREEGFCCEGNHVVVTKGEYAGDMGVSEGYSDGPDCAGMVRVRLVGGVRGTFPDTDLRAATKEEAIAFENSQ